MAMCLVGQAVNATCKLLPKLSSRVVLPLFSSDWLWFAMNSLSLFYIPLSHLICACLYSYADMGAVVVGI